LFLVQYPRLALRLVFCAFIFGWDGIKFHRMTGDVNQGNGDENGCILLMIWVGGNGRGGIDGVESASGMLSGQQAGMILLY
jgi:hypothetical protein